MKRKWIWIAAGALVLVLALTVTLVLTLRSRSAAPGGALPSDDGSRCAHPDENSDYICDECGWEMLLKLELFGINDLHGKFLDSSSQPGVDELTTWLLQRSGESIILSSGDSWQGSSESNLTQGALITRWFNELGVAAMTLGNHEFDWGETYVEYNVPIAEFPFLAINIYDRATNAPAEYCQGSVMVERAGIQVGIIGAIGDCYSSISGDKAGDFYFKTGDELTALVKAEAENLRAQGADLIVYSIHDGYERSGVTSISDRELAYYYDPSLSDGYVDVVFEAHTHQSYAATDSYGVWHLQGGGENRGISRAVASFDLRTGELIAVEGQVLDNTAYSSAPAHPMIQGLLEEFDQQIAQGSEVVGKNDKYRSGDSLRQIVAELYYRVGMERWGEEYPIVLGGGFISVRNPYNLSPGNVEYSTLQAIFPFDNQLVLCAIRGQELLDKFFATDNENYFIYYEEYGNQVLYTIDRNATYYLVTDSYSSSYAPNRLTEIERYDETTFARDLLADYIAAGNMELKPLDPGNYTLTPLAEALELCAGLIPGAETKDHYYVRGTIVSINSTRYGNMTISDGQGNSLYIYGTYDQAGSMRYENMEHKPQVGDTVVLYGPLVHFVTPNGESVYEMTDARVVTIE